VPSTSPSTRTALRRLSVALVAAAIGTGAFLAARRAPRAGLRVPRGAVALDGETDEPDWRGAARTGPFPGSDGHPARPYSEARFLRDDAHLYVALYAADEDIRARDDSFRLVFGDRTLDVSATGVVTAHRAGGRPWDSGARAASDLDGTPDDPRDWDEEWSDELSIPLDALGPAPLDLAIRRCDTPRDGKRVCAAWRGTLRLD
jgi:hypothetical protein